MAVLSPYLEGLVTPDELVNLPDAERAKAVLEADSKTLETALRIAKNRGSAFSAGDIAYELGRRAGYGPEDAE